VTNRITSEEKLFRCHFVHHESHIKSPEMNRSLRDEKPASNHLRQTRACTHTHLKNTTCGRLHLTLLSLRFVCRRSRVYSNYETDHKMVETNSTGRYAIISGIAKCSVSRCTHNQCTWYYSGLSCLTEVFLSGLFVSAEK